MIGLGPKQLACNWLTQTSYDSERRPVTELPPSYLRLYRTDITYRFLYILSISTMSSTLVFP
jgi:hypothetical protein